MQTYVCKRRVKCARVRRPRRPCPYPYAGSRGRPMSCDKLGSGESGVGSRGDPVLPVSSSSSGVRSPRTPRVHSAQCVPADLTWGLGTLGLSILCISIRITPADGLTQRERSALCNVALRAYIPWWGSCRRQMSKEASRPSRAATCGDHR